MKVNILRQISVAILFVFSSQLTWAQNGPLAVKPMHPVNNPLVDSIVLSLVGAGVIVENIRCNMVETSKSIGTFKAPGPWLGIQAGMMMVTGQADTMAGPNTGGGIISVQMPYADTVDGCSGGRQMLNQVLASQSTVVRRATDCVTIQFDIIPATDSIKFNYVFASEEYNTFVCSNFNDIFGFFIKGPGIAGDLSLGPNFPN
ncbi:MAG TPA: choice-of-anchor L domain-containing protein, partial [Catalimonadaceae bacterium]|nr:choice-of-anchor L domain-containing protein [Catalimonadaceae bacterium]